MASNINAISTTDFGLPSGIAQAIHHLERGGRSAKNAVTAHAGGGQANAVQVTENITRVTTVATAADSVKLPTALAGRACVVINAAAANSMDVFPDTGDAIDAGAANAQKAVAAGKTCMFFCAVNGTWNSLLSA